MMTDIKFMKGHGTKNDFVLIPDLLNEIEITPEQVIRICDRSIGIGADGILRISKDPNNLFFMDYRNADGSIAEMCGNGARVFAQYLYTHHLVTNKEFDFQTRAGLVHAQIHDDQSVSVTTKEAVLRPTFVEVSLNGKNYQAQGVDAPNPHAVSFVDDLAAIGSLEKAPEISPTTEFPLGVNVEFVKTISPAHVAMRVHERGSGETLSCGTGACAVAAVVRDRSDNKIDSVTIDLPGGTLNITFKNGEMIMRGPAVLEEEGIIPPEWFSN